MNAEQIRLQQAADRTANWKRWGPYLSERQWGTVREDYSQWGDSWNYFSHDQATKRPTGGAKTDCWASAIANAGFVFPWPSGTAATRFSKSGCSA
ncbi:MAG: hypothetical protein U0872_11150 [Planctomycetaceae bacterium]